MNSGRRIRRKHGSPIAQNPDEVRRARQEAGLQSRELAQLVGVSPQLMSDIESGNRSARPDVLQLIAKHTGKQPDQLKHRTSETPTRRCPTCHQTVACA
jgi:transcriptional regulator with XRE-family HTH domain